MTLEVIKFEGKNFSDLMDISEMDQVMLVANKLKPLENEILQYPEGNITLKKSGGVFMTLMPADLMKRINDLLNR